MKKERKDIRELEDSYEYFEILVNNRLKSISLEETNEKVVTEINKELNFIKEKGIAVAFIFLENLIKYCEEKGYIIKHTKLNINLPLMISLYWFNSYNKSFVRYIPDDKLIIELTIQKENKEDILSFVKSLLADNNCENVGVKLIFN